MVPTLEVGDRVLVNKLSYRFGDVERGDVIVFDRPGGAGPDGIAELIKRVIALPGETIEGRDDHIYIDGEQLDESYLPEGTITSTFGPEVIPAAQRVGHGRQPLGVRRLPSVQGHPRRQHRRAGPS